MDRSWAMWAIGVVTGTVVGVASCGSAREPDYVGAHAGGVVTPDGGVVVSRDAGVTAGSGGGGATSTTSTTSKTTGSWTWTCLDTTTGSGVDTAADGGDGCPGVCVYPGCHMCTMLSSHSPDVQATVDETCIARGGQLGQPECPSESLLGCCLRFGTNGDPIDCFYEGLGVSAETLKSQCEAAGFIWTDFSWACL